MCLYPTLMKNKKYMKNKKNGGIIPPVRDERIKFVAIKCNNCMECMKQKAREWQIRLMEDIRTNPDGKFITLTFSNEKMIELIDQSPTKNWPGMAELSGYDKDNEIATRALRLFNERWRKEYGKALRHWMITELGHQGTDRIHLHGIIWTKESYATIARKWQYGFIWPRPDNEKAIKKAYVSNRTINYIIKYVTKQDKDHPRYKPIILTSPGIGSNYTETMAAVQNQYIEKKTNETYRTKTGHKIVMPIYWRNKIYSEEEREKLWLEKLDKQIRYVGGEKIDISKSDKEYWETLKYYRERNKELGYGSNERDWKKVEYENAMREIKRNTAKQNNKSKIQIDRNATNITPLIVSKGVGLYIRNDIDKELKLSPEGGGPRELKKEGYKTEQEYNEGMKKYLYKGK